VGLGVRSGRKLRIKAVTAIVFSRRSGSPRLRKSCVPLAFAETTTTVAGGSFNASNPVGVFISVVVHCALTRPE
jgi:hypothetical protein